jgi:cardiolipin synthase
VLRRHGVATARFLSAWSTTGTRFINLRNHRKILSVDGRVAFVGGLNIRANNLLKSSSGDHTQDVHFLVEGPVINQINDVFVEDWQFAANESLELPRFESAVAGSVVSRVLLDGPDVNYQKLQLTMMAAINTACRNIRIVTPYFIPDGTLINALQLAVLRGVCVELLVPDKNNLKFIDWAMRANESKLLEYGITIYRSKPPFDHSKLFLVDEEWSLIGSSNWDSRSLELNFEINLECYDRAFNRELVELFDARSQQAAAVTGKRDQQLIARLRNNFFRLFSPYL